jgi:hypothetical protein
LLTVVPVLETSSTRVTIVEEGGWITTWILPVPHGPPDRDTRTSWPFVVVSPETSIVWLCSWDTLGTPTHFHCSEKVRYVEKDNLNVQSRYWSDNTLIN